MGKLLLPGHPSWEEFFTRLGGPEDINARLRGDRLVLDCDHSERMVFSRYLLSECAGLDVEASVAWFRGRGWRCDCEVLFCSDSSPEERQAWRRPREGR